MQWLRIRAARLVEPHGCRLGQANYCFAGEGGRAIATMPLAAALPQAEIFKRSGNVLEVVAIPAGAPPCRSLRHVRTNGALPAHSRGEFVGDGFLPGIVASRCFSRKGRLCLVGNRDRKVRLIRDRPKQTGNARPAAVQARTRMRAIQSRLLKALRARCCPAFLQWSSRNQAGES